MVPFLLVLAHSGGYYYIIMFSHWCQRGKGKKALVSHGGLDILRERLGIA